MHHPAFPRRRRSPLLLFTITVALTATVMALALGRTGSEGQAVEVARAAGEPVVPAPSGDVAFERFRRVDPNLPAIPPGRVKHFRVTVFEHVTKVAPDQPPTRVWSFAVNGQEDRGTGASPPMVVNQGDRVDITFVNGGSARANVTLAHSLDLHAADLAPSSAFRTIAPGGSMHIRFTATHPGVFLYHCASQPMLMHLGEGMVGMFVVKPRGLPPVDRELWVDQEEYFPGAPGQNADMNEMMAKQPKVVAFNGYAFQYRAQPIRVHTGERIRMYVLNAGPTQWSSFHVIGAVFDHTVIEGQEGHDAQAVSLAPAQGGWVDFTLHQRGAYPFVTHAFADMMEGADGALITEGVQASAALFF